MRQREGRFVAEGPGSVREAVRFAPEGIHTLYVVPDLPERLRPVLDEALAAERERRPRDPRGAGGDG